MGLNPMTGVFRRRGEDPDTQRRSHVKLKVELRVMQLKPRNAKDCWEIPESRKEGRKILP